MRRFVVAAAAIVCAVSAASVSAQSISGKYKVEYDSQIRMGPEGMQVAGRSPALLVLEVRGDSVFGTWQVINDANPPARKLVGRLRGDTVVVVAEPTQRTMNRNGESVTTTMIDEYKLTISGDAIAGTITATTNTGGMPPLVRKVDGKREK